jgi:hypothetical protein
VDGQAAAVRQHGRTDALRRGRRTGMNSRDGGVGLHIDPDR